MIKDLGPDFRKKKGVVLYSGCSCTCCCCCVHTLVSSFFFLRAFSRASMEDSSRNISSMMWLGIIFAPAVACLVGLEMYGLSNPRSDPSMVTLWTFLLLGPVVLPVLAFVSWLGGYAASAVDSVMGKPDSKSRLEALDKFFSHFVDAFTSSIVWVFLVIIILFLFLPHL